MESRTRETQGVRRLLEVLRRSGWGPAAGAGAPTPSAVYGVVESVDTSGETASHVVSCVVPGGDGVARTVAVVLEGVREVGGEAVEAGGRVLVLVHPATGGALLSRVADAANVAEVCHVPLGVTA